MPGEYDMWPEPRFGRRIVHVLQHTWAATVIYSARERRVMHGDQHSACELLALAARQRRLQIRELVIVQCGARAALGRDHPRILKDVAIEAEESNKRSFQRVIHAGLDHRRPV